MARKMKMNRENQTIYLFWRKTVIPVRLERAVSYETFCKLALTITKQDKWGLIPENACKRTMRRVLINYKRQPLIKRIFYAIKAKLDFNR